MSIAAARMKRSKSLFRSAASLMIAITVAVVRASVVVRASADAAGVVRRDLRDLRDHVVSAVR